MSRLEAFHSSTIKIELTSVVDVVRKVVDVAVYEGDAQVSTLHLEHGEQRPRVEVALVLHAQAPQGDVVHVQPREPPLEHRGGKQVHLGSEGPGQKEIGRWASFPARGEP